jgi:hypothetical protein
MKADGQDITVFVLFWYARAAPLHLLIVLPSSSGSSQNWQRRFLRIGFARLIVCQTFEGHLPLRAA